MNRRNFMGMTTGALAAGVIASHMPLALAGTTRSTGASGPLDAMAYTATRRFVATRYGKIACIERGTGQAALFLHGFPLNSFQWRGAIERLSPYRRCVAPDFMGLGYTQVAEGQSVSPAAQVDMLVALLDTLSITTVDVIASDSGGAVAQLFVTRHPQRVRTLLLANCDVEIDSPPPALLPVLELARQGRFADEWIAPWHADHALARSAEGIGGMCYLDPAHPTDEAIDTYFSPILESQRKKDLVHAYALGLDPNPLAGVEAGLKTCRVPTRIVWGMGDTIFSPKDPDYLDGILPNSRGVRRLAGSKLFWPEERPDVIAEEARLLWGVG